MTDVRVQDLVIRGTPAPQTILEGSVFDFALNRIRWLFDEFDGKVTVSSSGGKDSTVVMELAAIVARERGQKLRVHFLDQESEYQATIDYMRYVKRERDDIDLDWYQIPFRLFNATSHTEIWSNVWDVNLSEDEYIRPKEPDSIHENPFFDRRGNQIDRFKSVLAAINVKDGGAILTGMRCEESPSRRLFMTTRPTYKWVTWASTVGHSSDGYLFHPIYDWSYRDVWKAIHDEQWRYNTFYDKMFQYGVTLKAMRVSSFHHETSIGALDYLQEIEPETWERATRRLAGVSTRGHVGKDIHTYYLENRPHMFDTWADYTHYLIEKLVEKPDERIKYRNMWKRLERQLPDVPRTIISKAICLAVMGNDLYGSNVDTWATSQTMPNIAAEWYRARKEAEAKGTWDATTEAYRTEWDDE